MSRNSWFAVIGVIILLTAGWLIFRGSQGQQILNLDSEGTAVVAFGDSLVQGVGASEGRDLVSQLSARIGQPITNLGRSGDTTASASARVDRIFEHDPKIVIVLLGGNDFLRRVPADETFANLSKIVRTIQSMGAAVLVLGVRGGLLSDAYESRFEKFAREHGAAYVPNVLDGLLGDRTYMSDQIHPNDLGYEKIANKVYPVLLKMLTAND